MLWVFEFVVAGGCGVGSDKRPDDGDDTGTDTRFGKQLQFQLLNTQHLVDLVIALQSRKVQVLMFRFCQLQTQSDFFARLLIPYVLFDRYGIEDVPLILLDRVLTELVAQYDTALSFLSHASAQILRVDGVALDVSHFVLEGRRLQDQVYLFRRHMVPHYHDVGLREAVVAVVTLSQERLYRFRWRIPQQ